MSVAPMRTSPLVPANQDRTRRQRSVIAWTPPEGMDHAAWIQAGRRLGVVGRVSNWLIGDWVREGEVRWGERYAEASRITGFDPHSLRNMAYVSSRFSLSRRRDKLTWAHHAELTGLDQDQQDEWLDRALALKLSSKDLRIELRSLRVGQREPEDSQQSPTNLDGQQVVVCPSCGEKVPVPT